MQLTDYLYTPPTAGNPDKALIILPEIFGIQDFTRDLANQVAQETGWSGYVLDHFYAVTGKAEVIDYDDSARGLDIMQLMTGEKYLDLFLATLAEVKNRQPKLRRLAVWGFCFGGKLAWLSGTQADVTDIISFYGGASLASDFYHGQTVIEALCEKRQGDANKTLRAFGAFGEDDPMIPASDRAKIDRALTQAGIAHQLNIYKAGHAFYNDDRDKYVVAAAKRAWADVMIWLDS